MKTDFDYSSVPYNFAHCLNSQCPQAKECLRHLVAAHVPAQCKTINIINPAYPRSADKENDCFLSIRTQKFARGIKHLYDQLPYEKAIQIKRQIIQHFGKTHYYRMWRQEYLVSPSEQRYIARVFKSKGIDEAPAYDEIVDQYAWHKEE